MSDLDRTMRALRSRTRREILAMVWDREVSAGDIAGAFSVSAATISEHLAVLREAGLVQMTKAGNSRRYRARPEALTGLRGALEGATKWERADDVPEQDSSIAAVGRSVVAAVDAPVSVDEAFAAFTDAGLYTRWLQVPVSIDNGLFSATMEWGTEVRGRYEITVAPELVVMSWDFEDENVPVPGRPLTAYLRIRSVDDGSRVEVHQFVDTGEEAAFLQGAWATVLGRFRQNIEAVLAGDAPLPRARRPKRREPTPG